MMVDRVDAELLDAAGPGLQVVADVVVGYDNVDVAACTERGVVVTNTPGVLTDATADIAMALVLMTTRGLGAAERRVRTGRAVAVELHRRPRHRPAREDPRHRRPGRDRPGHGASRDGLRHGDPARRPFGARPRCRRGPGRAGGRPRRAAHGIRRRLAALPAHPGHAPPDRRRGAAGHEADRPPGQHRARPGGRRGGAGGGARGRARSPAPGSTSSRTSRACTPGCSTATTSRCCRTSARPRSRRARRWPTSPSANVLAVLAGDGPGHPGARAEPVLRDASRRCGAAALGASGIDRGRVGLEVGERVRRRARRAPPGPARIEVAAVRTPPPPGCRAPAPAARPRPRPCRRGSARRAHPRR